MSASFINQRSSFIIFLLWLLLASCGRGAVEPVALATEDMCAYCKMAISERRYAAECLDGDGGAFKFDDLGCLINFVKGRGRQAQITAYFVMDFNRREWIQGADAYYVRSPELKTPMGGQLIAFRDEAQAQAAVGTYQGRLLRFGELCNR